MHLKQIPMIIADESLLQCLRATLDNLVESSACII